MGNTLKQLLERDDGEMRDLTKIEFEVLDGGKCRWILWDGPERIYIAVLQPHDYRVVMGASLSMLMTMAGIPPWEAPARPRGNSRRHRHRCRRRRRRP